MKTVLWCLLFVNFCAVGKDLPWFYGTVILQNQKVLTGNVSVDPLHDLVLFRTADDRVQVYTPHKVTSVFYYDPDMDVNRKFVSIPEKSQPNHFSFFEVVVAGEISVLRKQYRGVAGRKLSHRDDFEYFTRIESSLLSLRKFSKSVFPMIQGKTVVREFIRSNNLDVFDLSDAIRIIMHYNKNVGTGITLSQK